MKNFTQLLPLSLLAASLFCCINNDYDLKKIQNTNTDIHFGGSEFGMPIGTLSPIALSSLIKETNLIRLVNGQYELQNQSKQSVTTPYITPINITPTVPPIASWNVNFDKVNINDINVPNILINASGSTPISGVATGSNVSKAIIINKTSDIAIGYTFSKELKQVNWVEFGANSSGIGDLISLNITPEYAGALSNASLDINSLAINFPYGFELGLDGTNSYGGTLSSDKKTITVSNKTLTLGTPIKFYVKKVSFNPATDQTPGNLDYQGQITCEANFQVKGTSTGTAGNVQVSFDMAKQLTIAEGQFNTNDISQYVNTTTSIAIDEPVDSKYIKSISEITIEKNCKLHLKTAINGLPDWVENISLKDYTIQFPKFIVFKAGQGVSSDNKIVINKSLSTSLGLDESYEIEGFVFDRDQNPIDGNHLRIKGDVAISGTFVISGVEKINSVNINGIEQIELTPTIGLDMIKVETVAGIINPQIDIEPINIEVELGSDMSFIENSTLDLTKTAIQIAATNPVGISAEIGLTINTYNQLGTKITQITQPTGIQITPSASSNIWLSNTKEGMPEGFSYVENTTLPSIFKRMPSRLEILLTANTEKYESVINMSSQSTDPIVFVCNIIAPINVGSEFELAYSDLVTGIQASIGDYLKFTPELILNVIASNNIPLNLTIAAKPLDKNGVELKGVSMVVDGVVGAGSKEGAFTNSNVAIKLKELNKGELSRLDKVEISFKGNATQALAGAPLKADQKLNVKVSAKIPGGVNVGK